MTNIKISFTSLGCSKNLVDSEIMLKLLTDSGFSIVEDIHADVAVINTCAFIGSAKQEAIDTILDIAWLKENRELKGIIVTGCLAERYRDEIMTELPEVDAVVGVGSIKRITEAVKAVLNGDKTIIADDAASLELGGERLLTTPSYMAYLKIAEGCDNCCTYCVIPSIRGRYRSREMSDVLAEAKSLADQGVREICVVAQDTTKYGLDLYSELRLPELVREIAKIDGLYWIRLFYCYPDGITDELVAVIRDEDKVVKYIDMPIQHISDKILSSMNRRGGADVIRSAISRLRQNVPGIAIRTTVITGFPGETDEDFDVLLNFIKETKFERLGAFAYSAEEGTPAERFQDQVDEQLREKRRDAVMETQSYVSEKYNESKLKTTIKVLYEGFDVVAECHFGRSQHDSPEIDGKIYFTTNDELKIGDFVNVKITEVLDYDLLGETC